MIATRLRQVFVDSPNSLGAKARMKRWELFLKTFPDIEDMDILDVGGTAETWHRSPARPRSVTVLNLFEPGKPDGETIVTVQGDACTATAALAAVDLPTEFDVVFSNSLIEHVGGHARRCELAAEIRRLAPRHWVQTPYRYFPVEPHWLFPGMQFMPVAARARVAKSWPLAHTRPSKIGEALDAVLWTELLSAVEMRSYFPDSTLLKERVLGMTKSLIAVR